MIRSDYGRYNPKRSSRKGNNQRTRIKLDHVNNALCKDPVDVTALKQLAILNKGLLSDGVRRKVWPQLVGINVYATSPRPVMSEITSYRDYNQVVLDVNRSLKRFPPGIEEATRMEKQNELVYLIVRILLKHPELHYYQGYHDICITFLFAVGEEMAFALLEKLSMTHFRYFMEETMEKTTQTLNYLYPILGRVNPELHDHMNRAGLGTIFCLSWLITWFGHVLNDYRYIVRLYDFFLACDPLMPIYLAAAIVLYRESEILATECDMAPLHGLLCRVPDNLPFETLIDRAVYLFLQYPPQDLAADVDALNNNGVVGLQEQTTNRKLRRLRSGNSQPAAHSRPHWLSLSTLTPRSWVGSKRIVWHMFLAVAAGSAATYILTYLGIGSWDVR